MQRPQQSFWFARPELDASGRSPRTVNPTATLMLGLGFEFSRTTRLNLSYTHLEQDVLTNSVLGNVQLGWSWNL